MKKILGCIKSAAIDFNMIQDGDVVGVGISGGKDSMTLLYALKLFQNFAPVEYKLKAFTVNLGFEDFDISPIKDFCKSIGIKHITEPTVIAKIVFEERKEKNPCSLCARFRRAALHKVCKDNDVTKLALGHHRNDAIETLFLSMFHEGRINTFDPVTYLSRRNLTMIRPMIYVEEREIKGAVKRNSIPTCKSPCPADGSTKREEIKQLLKQIYKQFPKANSNLLTALMNTEQLNIWNKD